MSGLGGSWCLYERGSEIALHGNPSTGAVVGLTRKQTDPSITTPPSITIQETTMNTMTTSTQLRGLIATAILGALAGCFAGVSAAADSDARSMTVKYGDLDLSNPQGAATLYRRIVQAARAVCDPADYSPWYLSAEHSCVNKAVADAVTKVGEPRLIAVYNAKNNQPLPFTVATAQNR
jgi:UrcA family protein